MWLAVPHRPSRVLQLPFPPRPLLRRACCIDTSSDDDEHITDNDAPLPSEHMGHPVVTRTWWVLSVVVNQITFIETQRQGSMIRNAHRTFEIPQSSPNLVTKHTVYGLCLLSSCGMSRKRFWQIQFQARFSAAYVCRLLQPSSPL